MQRNPTLPMSDALIIQQRFNHSEGVLLLLKVLNSSIKYVYVWFSYRSVAALTSWSESESEWGVFPDTFGVDAVCIPPSFQGLYRTRADESPWSTAITTIKTTLLHAKNADILRRELGTKVREQTDKERKPNKNTEEHNKRSQQTTTKPLVILTASLLNQIQCDLSGVSFK